MLILDLDDLLLTPEVETAMIVQRDDRRGRPRKPLGNEHVCRDAQVGSGVKKHALANVAVSLDSLDDLRVRLAAGRSVVQQLQELAARTMLPLRQVAELGAEIRQRKFPLHRLAADEGK